MAHYLDEIKNNLHIVKNKLKNQIIQREIRNVYQDIDFDIKELIDSINWYIENIETLKETDKVELASNINQELKRMIIYTKDKNNIHVYHVQLLDNINFLLEHSPTKKTTDTSPKKMISQEEFSKRYDELISKLTSYDKGCNLILQTKADKVDFKVYKNTNNSISVIAGEEKSKLSFTKDKLINIIYNGEQIEYHKSYIAVLIEKILDNSIFDSISMYTGTFFDNVVSRKENAEILNQREEDRLIAAGKLSDLENKFNSRQEDFDNLKMLLNQVETAEQDFKDAKNAVLEDLKIKVSYTYWEEQFKLYSKKYWQYLISSLIMSTLLLLFVFFFLKHNPLIVDITPETTKETVIKNDTNKTNNITINKQSLQLWEYGFLILFTTMIIWLIRIAAKITLSNYHLSIDANERVIMIKTYLALIKEGSGYDENDKKVILDNIFRPTNFGIIKDESSVTIADVVSSLKSK